MKSSIDESGWERSVVPIENHVDGREDFKRRASVLCNFRRNNANPEGIECSDAEDGIPAVGVEYEIIESELEMKELVILGMSAVAKIALYLYIPSANPKIDPKFQL